PGPTSRPLLVGIAFGIAAVDDDSGVVSDSERAQGLLELLRRAAVPVLPTLEQVRVEIERTGDVTLLVLLGNPEIDVEEKERSGRRRVRPPAVEKLPEP